MRIRVNTEVQCSSRGFNSARIILYTCHSEREINWSDIVNVDISLSLLETGIAAGGYKTGGLPPPSERISVAQLNHRHQLWRGGRC